MFASLSRSVVKHSWWYVVGWIILVLICKFACPSLADYTTSSAGAGLSSHYESTQATNVANKYFPSTVNASGSLAISNTNGSAITTDQQTSTTAPSIAGLVTYLNDKKIDGVAGVKTNNGVYPNGYFSANGKVQIVAVSFSAASGSTNVNNAVTTVRNDVNSYFKGTTLRGQLTGNAAIAVDTTSAYASAQTILTIFTVLGIVVVLLLVFRSPIIAFTPVVVVGVLHIAAASLTALLAKLLNFQVGTDLDPLLIVVMFGVGTDYVVFLLFKHRENVINMIPKDRVALRKVMDKSLSQMSIVILSAAMTVTIAFAALLTANLESLKTLGPGLMIGVILMGLAGVTLLPAIFNLAGNALFWPVKPKARPADAKHRTQSEYFADSVGRHPLLWVTGVAVFMAICCLGMISYLGPNGKTYNTLYELPTSTLSQQATNTISGAFPAGFIGPTQIYIASDNSKALNLTDVTNLQTEVKGISGVSSVTQLVGNNTSDPTASTAAYFNVILEANPYTIPAINLIQDTIEPKVNLSIPGAVVNVGGTSATFVDVRDSVLLSLKYVVPTAIVLIGIVLFFLLKRTIVASLWILLAVVFLYFAVLGLVSIIFLKLLGYDGLDFSVVMIAYLFVMAVGSDYNILVSDYIRSAHDSGKSALDAAKYAMAQGGPSISAAAAILAVTFASMLVTNIQLLEEIGASVMAACLIASFLLVSKGITGISILNRKSYWWPSRIHPPAAEEDGPPPAEATKEPVSV